MDFAAVLKPLFHAFWYLIPLFIVAGVIKSPWFKGWMGEALVNLSARLFLDKNTYHLIRNVTLPTEDGTTQIDHIIVSPYGVFVVETKNMKGWIFGSAKQRYWTQKIYKHSQKFQNPLHQNYKHVKTLQTLLGLSDAQVHSVVVFLGMRRLRRRCRATSQNDLDSLALLSAWRLRFSRRLRQRHWPLKSLVCRASALGSCGGEVV